MGGAIFLIAVILDITAFAIIMGHFFSMDRFSGKKSAWSIFAKVFSVIFNLALAYGIFWAIVLGLFLISPYGFFYKLDKIYISDFCTGFALLEVAVFLPYGLNFLLYKIWYRKVDISKWWTFPALVIGTGAFIVCVFEIFSGRYIRYWSQLEWIWR